MSLPAHVEAAFDNDHDHDATFDDNASDNAFANDVAWMSAPRNPYRLALLLAGVLMLLGAGVLIWFEVHSATENSGYYGVEQQFISTIEYLIPPGLIVGGLAGIIVWLALGALAARGRGDV